MSLKVTVINDAKKWNENVENLGGHPLQLWGWGTFKEGHRWQAERLLVQDSASNAVAVCQVLYRPVPGPFGDYIYAPRGPQIQVASQSRYPEVFQAIADHLKKTRKPLAVSFEPDIEDLSFNLKSPWRLAKTDILPARTLILDLTLSEDELLADMTKKHRQYIRKSGREESLTIKRVTTHAELAKCLETYRATSERAEFGLHEDQYYYDAFDILGENAAVWATYSGDEVVAFLFNTFSSTTSFELYGGMNATGQRLRANYALKWHAIRELKARGISRYDFGGLFNDGVTTFKKGWAKHENLLVGTWDFPGRGYTIWSRGLPLARKVMAKLRSR